MDKHHIGLLSADLAKAFWETFQMVGISLTIAVAVGIPMGLFLYVTSKDLFWENAFVNAASGFVINVIRSTPFVILLVLLLPLTQKIVGSTIGPIAASVPLAVAAT